MAKEACMAEFSPDVSVLQPNAQSRADHLGTVRIDVGDRRIHLLFYEEGGMRLRINHTPMVINECYLQGGKNDFTIVGLKPGD
jgi:hypothetical protein